MTRELVTYRVAGGSGAVDADPVTTEVVRNSLNIAANQMKRAIVRTAFSPCIVEVLDFAVAIYDRQVRMLAQAPSMPIFMGTMNFCVDSAVASVGGEENLEPGDIIIYNDPFGMGSHQQDLALVMPVYLNESELIGYTTIKGHLLDIGGKDPYSTDTVDVFQEGTIYPGIKLYKRGVLDEEMNRMLLANSRVPKMVDGDIRGEVVGCRTGAAALIEVVERFGLETFNQATERMFDHGESIVRSYFERIPDGRYVGHGVMDDDGVSDERVPFDVIVEVEGSTVRIDYSTVPDTRPGPINTPQASTISASRCAITMLAGGSEAPNEGHFRPIEVVTRPGSMFHPEWPAPCFLYGWPAMQAIEVIYQALSQAMPKAVPASSGGDVCAMIFWGNDPETGEPWADGAPHPIGQGAHAEGDGVSSMHIMQAATRYSPIEIWEAKFPWLVDEVSLAADSCGPGRHRGGLGVSFHFRMLADSWVTTTVDRTKTTPWGLQGGDDGVCNTIYAQMPDGERIGPFGKATRMFLPEGAVVELSSGGGGGYGPAAERDPAAVHNDIREGYITEAHARAHYPHAFADLQATAAE